MAPNSTTSKNGNNCDDDVSVDAVIPCYQERPEALYATTISCLNQTHSVDNVFIVDDGSPAPVSLPEPLQLPNVHVLRLNANRGISAARNEAIERSTADFLACVNTEIMIEPGWIETCLYYVLRHGEDIGACCTRIEPRHPDRLLTKWRMRSQELKYHRRPQTGPVDFAAGHAVLLDRRGVCAVGGYDETYRVAAEDSDLCYRLRDKGWESHVVGDSYAVSLQVDTVPLLARKVLRNRGWTLDTASAATSQLKPVQLHTAIGSLAFSFADQFARDAAKGRFAFTVVDVAVWASALKQVLRSTFLK
jgi:cellulose synthase/poly-beta-1,6-N-acetylglucosamine synthase-like glycosyltransferase